MLPTFSCQLSTGKTVPSGSATPLEPLEPRATLAHTTADALRERILAGHFPPGERLVEAEIARQLGISRGPVREALAKLREEALVRDVPRIGWFVSELTANDIREIYELRSAIEARAAGLIIQRDDPAAFAALDALFERLRQAAAADDREGFAQLDFEFHEDLTRLSGNSRLHRVFVNQAGVLRTLVRLEITTQYESLDGILSEHEHLLKEIQSRDRSRAQAACELHLEQAGDRVIRMLGMSA
jgi:DNA-binding GntR family transcriptional regulator